METLTPLPPCTTPRQLTDLERLAAADERLRHVRHQIAKAVRAQLAGEDVRQELAALIAAEDAAINAVKEAAQ